MENMGSASDAFAWSDAIRACNQAKNHYQREYSEHQGSTQDQEMAEVMGHLENVFEAMQAGVYRSQANVVRVVAALDVLGAYMSRTLLPPRGYVYRSASSADALLGPRSGYGERAV